MTTNWEDAFNNVFECPGCGMKGDELVIPIGNPNSPILILGEHPGKDEIKRGMPMVGAIGSVIKAELAYLGLDMCQCRITNIWLHLPTNKKECLNYGIERAIQEAQNRTAILLIGSETTKYFVGMSATDAAGIRLNSPLLSAPIIMSCPQPNFASGIGEVRLALKKFVAEVERI